MIYHYCLHRHLTGRARTRWIQLWCKTVGSLVSSDWSYDMNNAFIACSSKQSNHYHYVLYCSVVWCWRTIFLVFPLGFRRRESTDVEDLFIAHVSGMDTLARGLRNVAKLIKVIFEFLFSIDHLQYYETFFF